MLYLIERRVISSFVLKDKGKYIRVDETMKYDFSQGVYKLEDLQFEELKQLTGGEEND